jgi:MFS transporter, DHA1 family, chloramphenicol resistance protein
VSDHAQPRPAAGFAYRELTLVGTAVLVLSTTAFFRVPLLPEIGRDLAMSARELGLVTSTFAVGRLLSDLPVGRVLERIRPTGLLATSATIMVIGNVAISAAWRPLLVYVAAFLLGVASAVTNATGMHAFSVAAPRRRRGTSLAVFSTALLAGQGLGPLVGGTIAAATSWRTAHGVAAGACAVLVVGLVWSHLRRGQVGTTRDTSPEPADDTSTRSDTGGVTTWTWRIQRAALMFVAFAMFFAVGAMPQTLVPLIGADLSLPVGWIGVALGVGGGCRLIGGFVGGVLADRVSRRAALLPGLVLQAAGVALVAGTGVGWWLAGIVVMSLASWSIAVGATVLADLAPEGRLGPQLGGFRFVGDVGLILGPLVGTQLYDLSGRAAAVAAVAGVLLVAAVWCAVSVPETRAPAH